MVWLSGIDTGIILSVGLVGLTFRLISIDVLVSVGLSRGNIHAGLTSLMV